MKRKKVERLERRTRRAELNLGEVSRSRGIKPPMRRGCIPLLGRLFVVAAVLSFAMLGPS